MDQRHLSDRVRIGKTVAHGHILLTAATAGWGKTVQINGLFGAEQVQLLSVVYQRVDADIQQFGDGFQIDKLLRNPAVRKYPAEVIYNSVVLVLLRGLATEKGLAIIENLK